MLSFGACLFLSLSFSFQLSKMASQNAVSCAKSGDADWTNKTRFVNLIPAAQNHVKVSVAMLPTIDHDDNNRQCMVEILPEARAV